MKILASHEVAALLATLVIQPEALGCVMADEDYETLLADAAQLLARHWGSTVEEVVPPDVAGGMYAVRISAAPAPSPADGEGSASLPGIDSIRGSAASILRSLAERIR